MSQHTTPIGSVGHLVGAAFETAGHYLQSALLDILSGGLGQSLGVLILVISAAGALLTMLVFGGYRLWKWFIFGPAIFFALVAVRTPSTGAQWTFGLREYSFEPVKEATEGLSTGNPVIPQLTLDNPARVSAFFSVWARLSSQLTRILVAIVEGFGKNSDLTFLARGDRYLQLFHPKAADDDLKFFINLTAVNKCGDYFIRLKEYYNPAQNIVRRQDLEKALQAEGSRTVITSADYTSLFNWMTRHQILDEVRGMVDLNKPGLSCQDLWKIGITAFQRQSALFIDKIADANRPAELPKAEVVAELEKKFNQYIVYPPNNSVTLNGDQQLLAVINEVAARMFVNELSAVRPSLAQADLGEQNAGALGDIERSKEDFSRQLRIIHTTDAWEEKGDYLMAVLALPYVQGFILYFLAMTFPFFCLSVLIPGRINGIVLWMGLWLWAKLWDFGFAVVMLFDRFLYYLLPHGQPLTEEVARDPARALKALLEVDPTYSVYTYYHILATALAAVPIVTGFVVKRTGGDLMQIVSGQLTTFSGRIGESLVSYARNQTSESFLHQYTANADQALKSSLSAAYANPQVQGLMNEKATAIAATQYWGVAGLSVPQAYSSVGISRAENALNATVGVNGQAAIYNTLIGEPARVLDKYAQVSYFSSHSLFGNGPTFPHGDVLSKIQAYNTFPGMEALGGGLLSYQIDYEINRLGVVNSREASAAVLGSRVLNVLNSDAKLTAEDYGQRPDKSFAEQYQENVKTELESYQQRSERRRW
jgi:hypothetical protein